jgi:peptidoglycan/xylan/chitin deacetylase (PgdA/CDA1 family)
VKFSGSSFGRLGIKTTWFIPGHSMFIPGHSIETFPAEMKAVAEAGHEGGCSSAAARAHYAHETSWWQARVADPRRAGPPWQTA